MQDPLKQGLKRIHFSSSGLCLLSIRMQDPLKQGLKHLRYESIASLHKDSNARSIKTRIETCFAAEIPGIAFYSNARSIKTRIETFAVSRLIMQSLIRMQDPLKQGLKPLDK